jgi:hypothetical protein
VDPAHGFNIPGPPLALSVTERQLRSRLTRKRAQRDEEAKNRFTQNQPLEERLVEHATRLREEAKALPSGIVRDAILRRAEQAETGAHMTQWLRSPESKSNA